MSRGHLLFVRTHGNPPSDTRPGLFQRGADPSWRVWDVSAPAVAALGGRGEWLRNEEVFAWPPNCHVDAHFSAFSFFSFFQPVSASEATRCPGPSFP